MKLYCISGLGADRRAFRKLKLADVEIEHIDWIKHIKNESLESYATRLKSKIDEKEKFALLGLSFGGMLAYEIAKQTNPAKLILISSLVNRRELPWHFRVAGFLRLHKWLPVGWIKSSNFLTNWFFGAKTIEDKEVLNAIRGTDVQFAKWAMGAVLGWKNREVIDCVRIHGTKDRILPSRNLTIDYSIKGGSHFMIVSRSREVSKIISSILATAEK